MAASAAHPVTERPLATSLRTGDRGRDRVLRPKGAIAERRANQSRALIIALHRPWLVRAIDTPPETVMQGLGSSDEDRVGGFEHGGWAAPYFDEVQQQAAINRTPTHGRPSQRDRQIRSHSDGYSVHLVRHRTTRGTRGGAVGELKAGGGGNITVLGSGVVVSELMARDLVDESRIFLHPLLLGRGKRLFRSRNPCNSTDAQQRPPAYSCSLTNQPSRAGRKDNSHDHPSPSRFVPADTGGRRHRQDPPPDHLPTALPDRLSGRRSAPGACRGTARCLLTPVHRDLGRSQRLDQAWHPARSGRYPRGFATYARRTAGTGVWQVAA
jgi:hypothetical protein